MLFGKSPPSVSVMLCFGAEPGEESHGQATSGPSGGRVEGRAASCLWYTRGPQGKAPTPTHLSGERRATGVAAASGGKCSFWGPKCEYI